MARENRFVILLTEDERQIVEALAEAEKLPASTLARRRLLFEAEQRGIAPCFVRKCEPRWQVSEATPNAVA